MAVVKTILTVVFIIISVAGMLVKLTRIFVILFIVIAAVLNMSIF